MSKAVSGLSFRKVSAIKAQSLTPSTSDGVGRAATP